MSEQDTKTDQSPVEVPEAEVRTRRRRFSIVWVVPLVAILIGAWLVYKTYSEKGPTVTIAFKTAEGLEAGKTKIKYKDVEIGQVDSIQLNPDLNGVVVTAELVKEAEKFVSENTRFWVVRARVAAGEVSGLSTIFSGAYVGIDPGKPGKPKRDFRGLEIPPVVTAELPGAHFTLRSNTLGSLDIGSPVYYRRIKAGQVVSQHLDTDGQALTLKVFVNAPYHELVHKNTRFWNASGLDVTLDASGIRVNTESFVTLMIGGIAFDTPPNLADGGPVQEGEVFNLYASREDILEKTYVLKRKFLLYFDGSVRGLNAGAPVEFRGIRIGQVLDVTLKFDLSKNEVRIPVMIEIESDRFAATGSVPEGDERRRMMDELVKRGLRAQLKSGNLLTGQLLVDLDFHPEASPAQVKWDGELAIFPTIPAPLEELTTSLVQLLNKLERLPIEQIGNDLRDMAHGANRLVNSAELGQAVTALNDSLTQVRQMTTELNKTVTPGAEDAVSQLNITLKQAQQTLAELGDSVSQDSALYVELKRTLTELADAARSIRVMTDYLERNPDALIYGKGKAR